MKLRTSENKTDNSRLSPSMLTDCELLMRFANSGGTYCPNESCKLRLARHSNTKPEMEFHKNSPTKINSGRTMSTT